MHIKQYKNGIKNALLGLQYCSANNYSVRTTLYNSLGICYSEIGDLDKAIQCLEMALSIIELNRNEDSERFSFDSRSGFRDDKFRILSNLGNLAIQNDKLDDAANYIEEAKYVNNQSVIKVNDFRVYENLARIAYRKKNYDLA